MERVEAGDRWAWAATAVGEHTCHRGEQHRLQAGTEPPPALCWNSLDPQHHALQPPHLAQIDWAMPTARTKRITPLNAALAMKACLSCGTRAAA